MVFLRSPVATLREFKISASVSDFSYFLTEVKLAILLTECTYSLGSAALAWMMPNAF